MDQLFEALPREENDVLRQDGGEENRIHIRFATSLKGRYFIKELGKHRALSTAIAIIQNGTMENESCIISNLKDILTSAGSINVAQPGIIVVGDVVCEHPSYFEDEIQRVLHG